MDNHHGLALNINHNYNRDRKEQGGGEHMELPPGFRFHPTDEELVTHYLSRKVADPSFEPRAVGEVDLNKCEPWELPRKAKMGEKEWYFFCVRDRKYPTGLRTNRATEAGYWKATGKDKEIHRTGSLVGMKKTLVFYRGRAPKGEKSNWVMHEYRLEGSLAYYNLPKPSKNEWVLCRVFHKGAGAKKAPLLGSLGLGGLPRGPHSSAAASYESGMQLSPLLPALMDPASPFTTGANSNGAGAAAHVTCFSNAMEGYFQPPLLFSPPNNMTSGSAEGSKGARPAEMQVSMSQDTGVTTTEANAEISSVFSHQNMAAKQQCFNGGAVTGTEGSLSLENCLWEY